MSKTTTKRIRTGCKIIPFLKAPPKPAKKATKESLAPQLAEVLNAAYNHLEYCGYGRNAWERECARGLKTRIEAVLLAWEGVR